MNPKIGNGNYNDMMDFLGGGAPAQFSPGLLLEKLSLECAFPVARHGSHGDF